MGRKEYYALAQWIGRIRVSFDQSKLKFPVLLSKVEHGAWGTYSYFMESEGWFTIPQIRQAYDYGVVLTLHEVRYVLATEYEPFTDYMQYFIKLKNAADIDKEVLKTMEKTPENIKKLAEAEYNRTDSKLCMNSVLGKINSHIDRKQIVLSRDENDAIAFMADTRLSRYEDRGARHGGKKSATMRVHGRWLPRSYRGLQ